MRVQGHHTQPANCDSQATTWLHIRPLDASLKTIHLHAASNLRITDIALSAPATDKLPALGPLSAAYVHTNPLAALAADDKLRSIEAHPAIKRKLWTALAEKEEGELAINVSHGWVRLDEVAYDARRAEVGDQAGLEEIVIMVEYEIVMNGPPGEGVVFRRPGDGGNENVSYRDEVKRLLTDSNPSRSASRTSSSTRPRMMPLDTGSRASTTSGNDALGRWTSSSLVSWRWKARGRKRRATTTEATTGIKRLPTAVHTTRTGRKEAARA